MAHFKYGDRVRTTREYLFSGLHPVLLTEYNSTGTVVEYTNDGENYLIKFDGNVGGHDGTGRIDTGSREFWWVSRKYLFLTYEFNFQEIISQVRKLEQKILFK